MSVLKLIHRSLSDSDLRKLLGTDLKICLLYTSDAADE